VRLTECVCPFEGRYLVLGKHFAPIMSISAGTAMAFWTNPTIESGSEVFYPIRGNRSNKFEDIAVAARRVNATMMRPAHAQNKARWSFPSGSGNLESDQRPGEKDAKLQKRMEGCTKPVAGNKLQFLDRSPASPRNNGLMKVATRQNHCAPRTYQ
jgi:hypothetical protein